MAAKKKRAAARVNVKHNTAPVAAAHSPELNALLEQRRFELEASKAFMAERLRAQSIRLRRIRDEALAANGPPPRLTTPTTD
jgi:hypothetical protein